MELILDNIYKSYGSLPVLSGVSMKIASPDICCLMAPSGTGKTTILRLIMGLEKPDPVFRRISGRQADPGVFPAGECGPGPAGPSRQAVAFQGACKTSPRGSDHPPGLYFKRRDEAALRPAARPAGSL